MKTVRGRTGFRPPAERIKTVGRPAAGAPATAIRGSIQRAMSHQLSKVLTTEVEKMIPSAARAM
jgi:hypothetical protein